MWYPEIPEFTSLYLGIVIYGVIATTIGFFWGKSEMKYKLGNDQKRVAP